MRVVVMGRYNGGYIAESETWHTRCGTRSPRRGRDVWKVSLCVYKLFEFSPVLPTILDRETVFEIYICYKIRCTASRLGQNTLFFSTQTNSNRRKTDCNPNSNYVNGKSTQMCTRLQDLERHRSRITDTQSAHRDGRTRQTRQYTDRQTDR